MESVPVRVYEWEYDFDLIPNTIMHEAVCPDHLQVNANGPNDKLMVRGLIIGSWNRHFPDQQLEATDFEFTAPPVDWTNPNT